MASLTMCENSTSFACGHSWREHSSCNFMWCVLGQSFIKNVNRGFVIYFCFIFQNKKMAFIIGGLEYCLFITLVSFFLLLLGYICMLLFKFEKKGVYSLLRAFKAIAFVMLSFLLVEFYVL